MPPMEVRRGGETVELPERDASPPGAMLENRYSLRRSDGGPPAAGGGSLPPWGAPGGEGGEQCRHPRPAPPGTDRAVLERTRGVGRRQRPGKGNAPDARCIRRNYRPDI